MTTALVVHRGARVVERKELDSVVVPEPTDTWFPVGHNTVLDKVLSTLDGAGFVPQRSTLALSADNAKFFATVDLRLPVSPGVTLAVGVRNSIDRSLPISFCAGNRVFVCDNLAFRSEIVVSRKHTKNGKDRYIEAICKAVGALPEFANAESNRIRRFQQLELSDDMADAVLLRAYERGIVSHYYLPRVVSEWRKPTFEEFRPRTMWSLENAFTTVLGDLAKRNPQRFCAMTINLQGLLAQAAGNWRQTLTDAAAGVPPA